MVVSPKRPLFDTIQFNGKILISDTHELFTIANAVDIYSHERSLIGIVRAGNLVWHVWYVTWDNADNVSLTIAF
jgi:hypothetical protein